MGGLPGGVNVARKPSTALNAASNVRPSRVVQARDDSTANIAAMHTMTSRDFMRMMRP